MSTTEPPRYTEPPARPEGSSNIARHAWDELNRAGLFTENGGMIGRAVMDLVDVFVEQGHSGMSAGIVLDIFRRVVSVEPLTSLTDDPDEWRNVDGDNLWQSRRRPDAFSNDGGKTYYTLNEGCDVIHTSEVSA